jgi:hypothetical protein
MAPPRAGVRSCERRPDQLRRRREREEQVSGVSSASCSGRRTYVARGPEHASRGKTRAWVLLPPQLSLDSGSTVHPLRERPQTGSGTRRSGMLQEVCQTLGAVGRVQRHARGDGPRDQEELALDRGGHPARSPLDHHIQPTDRALEPPHHNEPRVQPIPVLRERDDLSHGPMMKAASDMPGRSSGSRPLGPN